MKSHNTKGESVILPESMRTEMLQIIHGSHLGIEKCKCGARDVIHWPGMSSQIEDTVSSCQVCSIHTREATQKTSFFHTTYQTDCGQKWEQTYVIELRGQHYLILVDYYSNFIDFDYMKETSEQVINAASLSLYVMHGIPDISSPPTGHNSQVISSLTLYPQSNGNAVQTFKNIYSRKPMTTDMTLIGPSQHANHCR